MPAIRLVSKHGERVRIKAPRNRGPKTRRCSVEYERARHGAVPCGGGLHQNAVVVFETYVEKVLAPTLEPGQIVVMDNLSAHKGQRVKELIERRGCE